jgi:small subunit ribosomal protein S19
MARKFIYKGKSLEELQAMPLDQFVLMLKSRARRTLKRLAPEYRQLITKVKKIGTTKPIKTQVREAVIIPQWVGLTFAVHGGKEFKQFIVTPEMIGHRLGEYVHTTGRVLHSGPGVGATRGSKFLPLK